jgi:hypothetical protein
MIVDSKKEGDKLVNFFNSDIITFLMKITQYSASPNHINEFKILNQLKVPDTLDYQLTKQEQDMIDKIIKQSHKEVSLQLPRRISKKVTKRPTKFRRSIRKKHV